jgi:ABC-2 type transport system ATP-binding protein
MSSTNPQNILEVHNLNKRFGPVHAVKGLNFEVAKGEVFGFLGPNGAGKSTTMRIITCFIPASSGTVKVAGMDTVSEALEIRRKIGYLAETNPLYNDMMVQEYLAFVGQIRGIKGPALSSRLDEMYHVCGLSKMVKRQIGKLSKGFRQRVGLAQAMLHNPDLLILDEPMSGLDPNQIIEIRQLIKKIGGEKTVIYCSHILSEVAATCKRILIINNGSIVATGAPDELINRMGKGSHYHLKLKAERAAIESKLSTVPAVSAVSVNPGSGEWLDVKVVTESKDDIGEALFQAAVSNGWRLSELKRETMSLEEVFTQLTRG